MKHIFTPLLASFLVMLSSAFTLHAQSVNVTSLTVKSPPVTSCTNTEVIASGMLSSAYIYNGSSFTVSGSNITINVDYIAGIIVIPVITPFSDTINLGMLAPGTYTITTNGRLNSAVQSTLVTPLTVVSCCPAVPSFTLSDTSLCPGGSVSLSSTSTGATGQSWYENNTFVSSSTNYNSSSLNTPGTYTYKLVVTDGSCSDSLEKEVIVHPFPTVDLGNDTGFCEYNTYLLFAGNGRDSVRWNTGATTSLLTVNTGGLYSVTVYENGCSGTDAITLTIYDAPEFSLGADTTICEGDSLVLSTGLSGSYIFDWQDGSLLPTHIARDSGIYWVDVFDVNFCTSRDSIRISLKDCSTGIGEITGETFTAYPNPAKEYIMIELPAVAERNRLKVELMNLQGKRVMSRQFSNVTATFKLSLPELAAGMYVLKISDERNQLWTRSISIQ